MIQVTPENILFFDRPVCFMSGWELFQNIDTQITDCGYVFSAPSDKPITMVVPCADGKLMVGDCYDNVPTRQGKEYFYDDFYWGQSDYVYAPVFHVVSNKTFSFATNNTCQIKFFKKSFEQYVSIEATPLNGTITFFVDVAENYLVNLRRHVIKRRQIWQSEIDKKLIQEAIYYGSEIQVASSYTEYLDFVCQVQKLLSEAGLQSILIGSLAENLGGIVSDVHDGDLMLATADEMNKAMDVLLAKDFFCILYEHRKRIRLQKDGKIVDLSWDNYNLCTHNNSLLTTQLPHGRCLIPEGLLLLCLFNQKHIEKSDFDYYPQNQRALMRINHYLHQKNSWCNNYLAETHINDLQKQKDWITICKRVGQFPMLFEDTRINEPLRVNCFGDEKNRLFAIINLGDKTPARVITSCHPTRAIWHGSDGEHVPVEIEHKDGFSLLFISNVKLSGLIEAEL